jgi:hypothetical protein
MIDAEVFEYDYKYPPPETEPVIASRSFATNITSSASSGYQAFSFTQGSTIPPVEEMSKLSVKGKSVAMSDFAGMIQS